RGRQARRIAAMPDEASLLTIQFSFFFRRPDWHYVCTLVITTSLQLYCRHAALSTVASVASMGARRGSFDLSLHRWWFGHPVHDALKPKAAVVVDQDTVEKNSMNKLV
ncbi:hypothetical protein BASA62_002997, partial [Batrachochytrium salamandrivorans]